MNTSIRQHYFYAHPPKDVWDFLTKPDLMVQWLMPNDFKPVVGHAFQFKVKPMPQFASDGIFNCQVLEVLPLKKLSYSWKSGPGDGSVNLDTVVTWTLREKDGGTELDLVHTGFSEKNNLPIYMGMTEGWLKNLEKIDKQLNTLKRANSNT